MTAPGDLVLIFLLVAVFVASSAYAVGRLHQRYQLKQDREAAYRDGYETASSRVFSLAARVAAPKRPARGAATVQPTPPDPARTPSPHPPRPGSALPGSALPGSPLSGLGLPGSPIFGSGLPGSSFSGSGLPGSSLPGSGLPGSPLPSSARPGSSLPSSSLNGSGLAGSGVDAARPSDVGAAEPAGGAASSTGSPAPSGLLDPSVAADEPHPGGSTDPGRAIRHQGVPMPAPEPFIPHRRRATPEASEEEGVLGFPAPPPPPRNTVAEPPAVGGVNYQPFRDPRPADGSAPVLGRRHTPADTPPESGGKHTVPDELVRATTYRLPPDRVFRAKVPNSTPLPEQTTTHLSVPKPRRRADENVVPPP